MTLAALLEELREVDPGEWDNLTMWNVNKELPETSPLSMFIIQGCIQRACERRVWFYGQFSMAHPGPFCADVTDSNNVDHYGSGIGDSAAEALLAAYIAAVREEEK